MQRLRILLLFSLFYLTSCTKTPFWYYYDAESFIYTYIDFEGWTDIYMRDNNFEMLTYDYITLVGAGNETHYSEESRGKNKQIYDELCVKNGDISYNRQNTLRPQHLSDAGFFDYREAYCKTIVDIDVVSNRDFDETHPAGSSLGDIITYNCTSYWEYVSECYPQEVVRGEEHNALMGHLNDIPSTGLRLVRLPYFDLKFDKIPKTAEGRHTLTVSIKTDDGALYTFDTKRVWTVAD